MEIKNINNKIRLKVFERDNFTCQSCGKKTPEVILEVRYKEKNESEEMNNLITSCFECNRDEMYFLVDNIFDEDEIHNKSILLAEREMQLNEYNYLKKKIRNREDKEISELSEYFSSHFDHPSYAEEDFNKIRVIVRKTLKFMSYVDIMDLMDLAIEITSKDSRGEYHNVAAAKYFVGILRNKLKDIKDV